LSGRQQPLGEAEALGGRADGNGGSLSVCREDRFTVRVVSAPFQNVSRFGFGSSSMTMIPWLIDGARFGRAECRQLGENNLAGGKTLAT